VAGVIGVFAFCVLILFAIFFHELGHFVTARWAGIKITKFFIGFGPTLWSVRRGRVEVVVGADGAPEARPETEYGVKALPLGGFVKIVGMSPMEEIAPEDEPRAFPAAPAWKRAIVLSAGSATHFVTAIFIMFLIFTAIGVPDPNRPTLEIAAIQLEIAGGPSPAAKADLKPGDEIVAVNGRPVDRFQDVRSTIRSSPHKPVTLTLVGDDGVRRNVSLRPVVDRVGSRSVPVIGIFPKDETRRQNPVAAIGSTGRTMAGLMRSFFGRVPQAFSPRTLGLTGGGPTNERPFSIIGAGRLAGDLASTGSLLDFLLLFVQINIFIAIFNMLPLPPLDGGHLLVLGIEKVRGKALSPRAIMPVAAVVLSILLLLGVLLAYYDIVQPPRLPTR
jgi:membrane-associated protease RseP (regulator of RpoE activity)